MPEHKMLTDRSRSRELALLHFSQNQFFFIAAFYPVKFTMLDNQFFFQINQLNLQHLTNQVI